MSLPYGLLGLLSYGDSTGYELTKMFADSLNNFWYAQASQIYRELDKMETKGWVYSFFVVQEKRPNKRVYAITDDGRNVLQEWLESREVEFERPREPFLMRIFFGAEAPESTMQLLEDCKNICQLANQQYPLVIKETIERYAASLPDGKLKSLYWQMTLDFGIAQSEMVAKWADACIARLKEVND